MNIDMMYDMILYVCRGIA